MTDSTIDTLRRLPLFRRLSEGDRASLADVAELVAFVRGQPIFTEGDPSRDLFILVSGRAKVVKAMPEGRDMILELFGPGDAVGAVAVYEEIPYPASAVALEPISCLRIARTDFFRLLETRPTLARGILTALTHRLVALTNRLVDRNGRVESRLARLFLKLAGDLGARTDEGLHIPLALTRQELADLTGTTVETSIRIMSRWGREGPVQSTEGGFLITDRRALETLSLG